jgi:hypothetical protein
MARGALKATDERAELTDNRKTKSPAYARLFDESLHVLKH